MTDLDRAKALFFRGLDDLDAGNLEDAEGAFRATLAIVPQHGPSLNNLSIVFFKQKRIEEAADFAAAAIAADPDNIDAHIALARCRKEQERWEEGLVHLRRAAALDPDNAEVFANQSFILNHLKQFDESIASADCALAIDPDYADAHLNRGVALRNLRRYKEAITAYEQAITRNPDFDFLSAAKLFAEITICDWRNYNRDMQHVLAKVARGEKAADPLIAVSICDDPQLQYAASKTWIDAKFPVLSSLPGIGRYALREKIRIGYFSADFHAHATMHLMAELFRWHDRSKFDIVAFSFGPRIEDDMRGRVRRTFDEFIDVRDMSDLEVATLARQREIDIAVDLKGVTEDARTGIFAARAAPIQVNYLGYPGTMAADYIDYIIADEIIVPRTHQRFYAEKIAYLPHSYQPNDTTRAVADRIFTRAEMGLPAEGFVFCCFNNNFKITPNVFDDWMSILKQVEGSVLWLFEDNPDVPPNLRREAEARGVRSDRLVFARRMALPEHLARHRLAGLFLDTLPYNAHTTASDALWAGLPVLTLQGEAFASRVASSLLHAIGLPELIAKTRDDYIDLAVALARDPVRLSALRQKLAAGCLTEALFDIKSFTADLERLYIKMQERYRLGLPPKNMDVF